MIIGQRMDLVKKEYDMFDEVKIYFYYVVSMVGLMFLLILVLIIYKELEEEVIVLGIVM